MLKLHISSGRHSCLGGAWRSLLTVTPFFLARQELRWGQPACLRAAPHGACITLGLDKYVNFSAIKVPTPPLRLKHFDWLKRFPVEFELANQQALFEELKERTFLLTSIYY